MNRVVRMNLILKILFLTNRYWLLLFILSIGMLILQIILLLTFFLRISHLSKRRSFCMMLTGTSGTSLICLGYVLTISFGDALALMLSISESCHSSPVGGHHGG